MHVSRSVGAALLRLAALALIFTALVAVPALAVPSPEDDPSSTDAPAEQTPAPSDGGGADPVDPPDEEAPPSPTPGEDATDPPEDAPPADDPPTTEAPEDEAPETEEPEDGEDGEESRSEGEEEEETDRTDLPRIAAADPRDGSRTCSYADPGSGAYASTLCWLDMSGITTEYAPVSIETTRNGILSYTTTLVYQSKQDPALTRTFTGDASNSSLSATRAWRALEETLHSPRPGDREKATWYGPLDGVPIELELEGGYTLTAELRVSPVSGPSANFVLPSAFPTWEYPANGTGAFLGRHGFYTGVDGRPAVYQQEDRASTTEVSLRNIELRSVEDGQAVSGYSIVVADAESTDAGESIAWSHTGGTGFSWLPNDPEGFAAAPSGSAGDAARRKAAIGNACGATPDTAFRTAFAGSTLTCSGSGNADRTGTAMLQISPADATGDFSVTQRMVGNTRQGIAFGVVLAGARINVDVDDRLLDEDGETSTTELSARFGTRLAGAEASAAGTDLSASAEQYFPADIGAEAPAEQITFEESSPADPALASYTQSWTCEKTSRISSSREPWEGNGGSAPPPPSWAQVRGGEFVECTVSFTPPYLTLVKDIDADGTDAPDSDAAAFRLHAVGAEGNDAPSAGFADGAGLEDAPRLPLAAGTYALSESVPDESALSWQNGYTWRDLVCEDGAEPEIETDANGVVGSASLDLTAGQDVSCTFVNSADEPDLTTAKEVFDADGDSLAPEPQGDGEEHDATGEATAAGETLTYRLTFDNRTGTSPAEIDHVDHLVDVLDDADYAAAVRHGTEVGTAPRDESSEDVTVETSGIDDAGRPTSEAPELTIRGTVPAYQARTVSFEVRVRENSVDAEARQRTATTDEDGPTTGYLLVNHLLPAGEEPPDSCTAPLTGDPSCTLTPVPAWGMQKTSLPADSARLHTGGNVHYRLSATVMNEATDLHGLVISDDLTDVFDTAGWAPDAAVPGGAKPLGIYFLDEDGNSLDRDGAVLSSPPEAPVAAFGADEVPLPSRSGGRWILTSPSLDLPASAVRAELWFAVQAGESPAGIPTLDDTPASGSTFTNYATADSAAIAPNQCRTGDVQPGAEEFPAECTVTHELRDNYFTIRKDAAGGGVAHLVDDESWDPDPTGLWNLVGHELEIHDDAEGAPSDHPSVKMCRSSYDPRQDGGWDGSWISQDQAGDASLWDWDEGSQTLEAIRAWNQEYPDDQLPLCATLYEISDGGQKGRWRSENLEHGDYWLIETKAPTHQANADASATRPVPGVQRLAEPVGFTVWPEEDGPSVGGSSQAMHGRGQLDVLTDGSDFSDPDFRGRCEPQANTVDRPAACVNPTGYLMLVKDPAPSPLPAAGGPGTTAFTTLGALILAATGLAVWRWRRDPTSQEARS